MSNVSGKFFLIVYLLLNGITHIIKGLSNYSIIFPQGFLHSKKLVKQVPIKLYFNLRSLKIKAHLRLPKKAHCLYLVLNTQKTSNFY